MTLLLLDTTFLIDAERSDERLDALIADDDDVAIAAVTVAELLVGVQLASEHRRAPREAYVHDLIDAIPVIPYDMAVAREHAVLLAAVREMGRPRGAHDLMIAATARASGRSVVSADRAAFEDLPRVTLAAESRPGSS